MRSFGFYVSSAEPDINPDNRS